MDLERDKDHRLDALDCVSFCLDQLEKFEDDGDFLSKNICPRLSYEEVCGALVAAEQELKHNRYMEDMRKRKV